MTSTTLCGPLVYHTGPVVSTGGVVGRNTVYAVYWQPPGFAPGFPSTYKAVVDTYLEDVAATSGKPTNVYATDQQYYEKTGSTKQHIHYTVAFGGRITLSTAFPANGCSPTGYYAKSKGGATVCLTDAQEQAELTHYVTAVNATAKIGLGRIYMMFFPPGVETCFVTPGSTATSGTCSAAATANTAAYCGYHSAYYPDGTTVLLYANMPYPTTHGGCYVKKEAPNGTFNADTMISIVSHEQNETITDPLGRSWLATTPPTWEGGDLCAYSYGTVEGTAGAQYNQTINGVPYLTQLEYSNEDHTSASNGCIGSEELPTAAFTGTPTPRQGFPDGFTASASADPDNSAAPLSYAWTWGDGTKGTGVRPSHVFATPGPHTVTLTVTDVDGWSGSTTSVVTVGVAAPTAPTAPENLRETAVTQSSVGLAWTAPSSDGGSAVTQYLVDETGAPVATVASTTPADTVGGLSAGTTYHFTVTAQNAAGTSPASNSLSVTTTAPPPSPPPPTPQASGYDLVGSDGGVFVLPTGNPGGFYGSLPGLGIAVNDIVGMVPTADDRGYFLVGSDGGVFSFGDAPYLGSLPGLGVTPAQPITGIVPTGTDRGYFLIGRDGGVYAFGNAPFLGSLPGDGVRADDVVGIAALPSGNGYWVVSATGTVYAFGTASQLGSANGIASPVTAIAGTPTGGGYWIVTQNGAVDAFGNARSFGSLPGLGVAPAAPVIGVVHTSGTGGYWLIGSDGGVFAFGDAGFVGSLPGLGVRVSDIVGAVPTE